MYKDTALRYHDKHINCSVELHDDLSIQWEHEDYLLSTANNANYSQNSTGLTIHNVTENDQGSYSCLVGNVNSLNATILLSVVCKTNIAVIAHM